MLVHVTVHLDLRPNHNREHFNDLMSLDDWNKVLVVFTTWHRPFNAASVDAARDEAIKMVRKAAKAAKVTFDGVVVAGNTAPVRFDSTAIIETSEEEFMRGLLEHVMPSSRRR